MLDTNKLSATIVGLRKYTNYSIQVLAYTRMGEGGASSPTYVSTQEDGMLNETIYLLTMHPSMYQADVYVLLHACMLFAVHLSAADDRLILTDTSDKNMPARCKFCLRIIHNLNVW